MPDFEIDKISPLRKYPLAQEVELLKNVAVVIFGSDSKEAWEMLGRLNFEAARDSNLGKVILPLLGKKPVELVKSGPRVFSFFAPFIKFSYQDLTEHGATFTLENDPYPKEYFLGSFKALGEFLGTGVKIEVFEVEAGKRIYKLSW